MWGVNASLNQDWENACVHNLPALPPPPAPPLPAFFLKPRSNSLPTVPLDKERQNHAAQMKDTLAELMKTVGARVRMRRASMYGLRPFDQNATHVSKSLGDEDGLVSEDETDDDSDSSSASSADSMARSVDDLDDQISYAGDPYMTTFCGICYDDSSSTEMASLKCGCFFCRNCMAQYLRSKIFSGQVLEIRCPNPECTHVLTETEIEGLLSEAMHIKYIEFRNIADVNRDPTKRWCPKPNCNTSIEGSIESPKAVCPKCNTEICFKCGDVWHPFLTCKEQEKKKAKKSKGKGKKEDKRSRKWTKKHTKKCPNCKAPTEKLHGCNHMTCTYCSYQWCWLCRGKYTYNHYDLSPGNFFKGCPGMSSNKFRGFGWVRRTAIRSGIVLGGIVAGGLAVPVIVGGAPFYGMYRLGRKAKQIRRERRRRRRIERQRSDLQRAIQQKGISNISIVHPFELQRERASFP